jgi:hypothetical protein
MRHLTGAIFIFAASIWGQSYTGSIRGTITDNSKAGVPAAKITATDTERRIDYSTATDSAGRYILPTLPAAQYTLSVEAPGFDKAVQPAFRLEVQQQATVDVELKVGAVTTSVEVQTTAPLLNTTSATLGQVIEDHVIQSVPNSSRNPLSLGAAGTGHRWFHGRRLLYFQRRPK